MPAWETRKRRGHNLSSGELRAASKTVLKADLTEAESRTVVTRAPEGGEGMQGETVDEYWPQSTLELAG